MTLDVDQTRVSEGTAPESGARSARRSAFANVPVSDYVTDVIAAILLLVSLSMPWTMLDGIAVKAGDIAWVLPVTLLSLLTLALPYLARFGVMPSTWTVHTTRKARLLANLPYGVVILVHLGLDGAEFGGYQGLGTAAALGLAGAVLSATPRRCELGPVSTDRSASSTWWKISIGIIALVGVVALAWITLFSIDFFKIPRIRSGDVKEYILVLVEVIAVVALCVIPALLTVMKRSFAWRNVAIVLAVVVAIVFFIGDAGQVAFESLRYGALQSDALWYDDSIFLGLLSVGVLFVPALGAALASPAVARRLNQQHDVTTWLTTANAALRFVAVTAGVLILVSAIALVGGEPLAPGITACVLLLIGLVLSLVADKAMLRNVVEGHRIALLAAGITFVLGICLVIAAPVTTRIRWIGSEESLTWAYLLFAFGLPILICVALIGPASVRKFFASNAPSKTTQRAGAYEWQEPAAPTAVQNAAYGQNSQMQPPPVQAGHVPYSQGGPQAYGAQQQQQQQQQQHMPPPPQQQPPAQAQQMPPQQQSYPPMQGSEASPARNDSEASVAPESAQHPGDGTAPKARSEQVQTAAVTDQLDARDIHSGFTPQIASDPQTPGAVLAQIVEDAPHLRPEVAGNPTTYPALLDWLGELGDPAIDEALRRRK